MVGLPGVGKTTVARRLANHFGAERFRSDVVRKELVETPTYSSEESQRVYEELVTRAEARLNDGCSVVLDATFSSVSRRELANTMATRVDVPVDFVRVVCSEEVVESRIRQREDDASDADFGVYLKAKESFEPVKWPHFCVDNSGSMETTEAQITALCEVFGAVS